jgi:MFS family permease
VLRAFHWRPEKLLAAGALLATVAMLVCILARNYLEMFLTLTLLGVALGLMLPGNMASLSLRAGSGAQGKVAGINVVAQGFGLAIGPFAGANLHQISVRLPFIVATILLLGAAALAIHAWRSIGKAATDTIT